MWIYLLRRDLACKGSFGPKWTVARGRRSFGKGLRSIVQSDDSAKVAVFIERQRTEVGFAKTRRVRQHGLQIQDRVRWENLR